MTADQPDPTEAPSAALEPDPTLTEALARIATGETVSKVAEGLGIRPDTLRKRLYLDPRYSHARESQAHAMAEKCAEIAAGATQQSERVDRLRIDTYKWLVSKLLPATYGDRAGEGAQSVRLEVVVRREGNIAADAYPALPPAPLQIPATVAGSSSDENA